MSLTISVALCTCDGARFLDAQLESLCMQSRRPDEVIVFDDASTDATADLAERFADRAPFPVRLLCNPRRVGVVANFEQAISACTGDLIFLCDQDDVWDPMKIEIFAKLFESDAGIAAVFCDADVVGDDLRPLGYRLWQRVGFSVAEQAEAQVAGLLDVVLRRATVTGATMAFRSSARPAFLPVPRGWVHDEWIALVLSAQAQVRPIPQALVQYRQHSANQIGAKPTSALRQFREALVMDRDTYYALELGRWQAATARMRGLAAEGMISSGVLSKIHGKLEHVQCRAALPRLRVRRIPEVLREWGRGTYRRYSAGSAVAVKDLLLPP